MSDFRPLFPRQIDENRAAVVDPLAWTELIAHRFPSLPSRQDPEEAPAVGPGGVQRALFGSIEAIAELEERQRRVGLPEPADVLLLRSEAAEKARLLVEAAEAQVGAIREAARTEGYRQGYDAGWSAGERDAVRETTERFEIERQAQRLALEEFMNSVEATSRRAWIEMEPEILSLVFEIAHKVLKMEVQLNREAAVEVVKNTLRRVADSTSLRIRVHADDLQTIRANRDELYSMVDGTRKVEIVEDRRVGLGGCILETDAGTIDARIETQLEEIRKLLAQSAADTVETPMSPSNGPY